MPSQYRIKRIVEIGDTLHRCGCAPYKVERYTTFYANKHGVNCMIQATPTAINYQFPDDNNAVILKRHKPASIDLGLLANTIIRLQQPLTENPPPPAESVFFPTWIIALANVCIPPAFLM
ncbi:threonine/serine exporter family protein, partial [Aliivibrio sifiae]